MKKHSAITIVESSNGFIVFEQDEIVIPQRAAERIATFAELDGGYRTDPTTLLPYIRKHFTDDPLDNKIVEPPNQDEEKRIRFMK